MPKPMPNDDSERDDVDRDGPESDEIAEPEDASPSSAQPGRPDWLMGAAESAMRDPAGLVANDAPTPEAQPGGPLRLRDKPGRATPPTLRVIESPEPAPPDDADLADDEEPFRRDEPVRGEAWKGASSSVPRLRQKAVAAEPADELDGFSVYAKGANKAAETDEAAEEKPAMAQAPPEPSPLGGETPLWLIWLDHVRFIGHPVFIGMAAVLAVGLLAANFLVAPRVQSGDSVARIRQQPEAYEGRSVTVGGVAGEAYAVGPSTAFNLFQGRDTIVVYSRVLRPRLHEKVRVTGTVSVGYLDGVPRVTLLDDAKR